MPPKPLPLFDPGQMERHLEQGRKPLEVYRQALRDGRESLRRNFEAGTPIEHLVNGRAEQLDQILRHVWARFFAAEFDDIALVAVGGYGRGELHPHSDIDLMLLTAAGAQENHRPQIESFITFLWDIGLEVGHSVRSVQDCVREGALDITVATNLMEARLLAGPEPLFEAMRAATGPEQLWPSNQFFEAKWREQQQRHRKFHDTAYNLEPNIKEGPGGLRDIQMIGWVAKRHFGATTLHDLVAHGFLTDSEYRALIDGQNFLWHVRFALHSMTGRREDRLLFDYQRSLALQFGYQDGDHNLAVEQFMQRYYRSIMELARLNEMLLQLFQEAILYANDPGEPVAINKRFQARKGFIEATNTKVFKRYPFALLEVFLLLQQNPELKGVRAATIRLIRDHCHLIDASFRADVRARSLFMEILRQPLGINRELRRMNRYGVLAAYLPAFGRIVGRMQYDLFHVYTVDEHSLFVVRNLRRFAIPEFRHEFPLCSAIIGAIAKSELLYLGALFHDIAKGRAGDHSELGADEAAEFCLDHGLSLFDARLVAWLVRNHLVMSMTSQRKDISDPQVINDFAALVGDQMHLDYLYLLTVADIRATNPDLWNSWKDALLTELYNSTKTALRRGLERPIDQDERIEEMQREARVLLQQASIGDAEIDSVWQNFNEDYFLRHNGDEIAWHTQSILHSKPDDMPLVLLRQKLRGSTAIFIYGPDQDNQFALTTAVLEQLALTVVEARVITSQSGYTLDTYLVLEATGTPIENEHRLLEIQHVLHERLKHSAERITQVTRRPPRRLKHFEIKTEVHFEQDQHNDRTIMEVVTSDRPGLLSRIGRAFMQCGIRVQNARITTIGAQAEDVFYITDLNNRPLQTAEQFERLGSTVKQQLEA